MGELTHYLECPTLWQLVAEKLGASSSLRIDQRLCFVEPTLLKLQQIALTHFIYHECKNDSSCVSALNGYCTLSPIVSPFPLVISRASGFAITGKFLV